ncbi:uroplakin-2 [Lissotriton helveticus]
MTLTTTLSALLLLAAASNAQDTFQTNLTGRGLYTKDFSTFAIVDFPPCQYSGQNAILMITMILNSTNSAPLVNVTTEVPQCRTRRASGAIVLSDSSSGNTVTRNIGVRVENLSQNTKYMASYVIGGVVKGSNVNFTTRPVQSYTDIPDTMQRSGGMVVITVLLSIAMPILILGLVGTLVFGGGKS